MSKITLHGPALRNDGTYADAGTTLEIGDGPREIESARAKELRDNGTAVTEAQAKNEGDGLEAKTAAELRKLAAERGVTVEGDANKPAIIKALREAAQPS